MSSLETSVTLEDVFTVVDAKRVPLAPELAGYLTLEIADGTDAGSGDVDPKTVFISEAGTVALVRPKKDPVTGEAEASVRKLLTQLLDASGSGTPALTTAARRKPGNGLPALVEELEAALIPVNRAAGRRALARLAREVKRVLLGVGRNASAPVQNRPEPKAVSAPHPRPVLRKRDEDRPSVPGNADPSAHGGVRRVSSFGDEAATAKRTNELNELLTNMSAGLGAPSPADGVAAASEAAKAPDAGVVDLEAPPPALNSAPAGASPRPAGVAAPQPPPKLGSAPPAPPPPARREGRIVFEGDEVDSLLDSFGVSSAHEDKQMARELKAIAGLSPTPPPPDTKTLAELTKDVGKGPVKHDALAMDGDSVEALLAMTDVSHPIGATNSHSSAASLPRRSAKDEDASPSASPPAPAPPSPANLPPSPIFGAGGSSVSSAASAPGAPAALRRTADTLQAFGPGNDDVLAHTSFKQPEPPRFDPPKPIPRGSSATGSASSSGSRPKANESSSPSASSKRSRSASGAQQPRAPKTGMAMLVFALLVLAGGTIAVWKFAPQVFTGKKKTLPAAATSASAPVAPSPKCKVALVLTDVPANAEILLRMGQAPVDVERMPVGTRLELVATAEGYAPRRAVIKGDSPWDKTPDGKPRIEVPIQLDPSKAKTGTVDPWPAAEPGTQVGGTGTPGTVHVVSNVRGAEVWLLAGLGPEARIDQLRCDGDIDVLLAGPPALRRRLHVSEKDVAATSADAQGNKVVNVGAK